MDGLFADLDLNNPTAGAGSAGHVLATESALDLLERIQNRYGAVSFHHEGGYGNGTDAMCLPLGEMRVSDVDILIGTVLGAPVFVYGRHVQDWDERQFVLDAIDGTGRAFSLDGGTGKRFYVRSKPFENASSTEI